MNVMAYDPDHLLSVQIHASGALSETDMTELLDRIRQQLRDAQHAAKPWATLLVLESETGASPTQRKRIGDALAASEVGYMAIVTKSALLRAAMTAMRWMRRSPIVESSHSDYLEARDWLSARTGIPVTVIDTLSEQARSSIR